MENISIKDWIVLKKAFKSVNNIITLETALSFVDFLKARGVISEEQCQATKNVLRSQSANTNGYDVHIRDEKPTKKIIAEVKCNSPVGGAKGFGAAQKDEIIKDLRGLQQGKTKAQNIHVGEYAKFMVLLLESPNVIEAMHKLLGKIGTITEDVSLKEGLNTGLIYIVYIDPESAAKSKVEAVRLNGPLPAKSK